MKKILQKTSWIDDNLGMYPPPWRVLLHGGGEDDDWEPVKHGDEETCREFILAYRERECLSPVECGRLGPTARLSLRELRVGGNRSISIVDNDSHW